jgi:hypothetical protein
MFLVMGQSKCPIAKKIKIKFCASDAPQLIKSIIMNHKKYPISC